MLSLGNLIRRIKSPFNYNIGFIEVTPDEFIKNKGFGKEKVRWLKHGFSDRWFADPFIIHVDDKIIIVLAEEKEYGKLGRLVKLTVDRNSKKLIGRSVILDLSTHLSYPNPIGYEGETYIYPENSQSGALSIYRYNNDSELKFIKTLIDQPLNDSSIVKNPADGKYYLIATNTNLSPHNHTLMFVSDSIMGEWKQLSEAPIITDDRLARPGGNFFKVDNKIFRPAQDCNGEYGNSLHIMEVESIYPWKEKEVFHLVPNSYKYSRGLHTLNFHQSGIAVIDGNGYAYPVLGRLFGPILEKIIHH